jgi:hypothetical protein
MIESAKDSARLKRLLALLDEALDQPTDDQEAWLSRVEDAGLRRDLVLLLSHRGDAALERRIEIGPGVPAVAPRVWH